MAHARPMYSKNAWLEGAENRKKKGRPTGDGRVRRTIGGQGNGVEPNLVVAPPGSVRGGRGRGGMYIMII